MHNLLALLLFGFILYLVSPLLLVAVVVLFFGGGFALVWYLSKQDRKREGYWRGVPEKNRPPHMRKEKQQEEKQQEKNQSAARGSAEPSLGVRLLKAGLASDRRQQSALKAASDFAVLQKNMQQQNNSHGVGW